MFPVLRQNEERQQGEYNTARLALAAYDLLAPEMAGVAVRRASVQVNAERLKSAAELLALHRDTLKLIDGAGPDAPNQDQNKAEPTSANGKEPEQQTVSENERTSTRKTAEVRGQTSISPTCTFTGELVPIDLKRFTESSVSLVECPDCGRMRSRSPPGKGALRFKAHTRCKQQTPLTDNVGRPREKPTGVWLEDKR